MKAKTVYIIPNGVHYYSRSVIGMRAELVQNHGMSYKAALDLVNNWIVEGEIVKGLTFDFDGHYVLSSSKSSLV